VGAEVVGITVVGPVGSVVPGGELAGEGVVGLGLFTAWPIMSSSFSSEVFERTIFSAAIGYQAHQVRTYLHLHRPRSNNKVK
jgi:hypothetical protein